MTSRLTVGTETLDQGEDTVHPRGLILVGPTRPLGRKEGVRESVHQPSQAQRPGSKQVVGSLPGGSGHPCPQLPRQPTEQPAFLAPTTALPVPSWLRGSL